MKSKLQTRRALNIFSESIDSGANVFCRLLCSIVAVFAMSWVGLSYATTPTGMVPAPTGKPPATHSQTITQLPLLAQGAISSALGRNDAGYHARPDRTGFQVSNRKHGLIASFRRDGVDVAAGKERVHLAFKALGYGERLRTVKPVPPKANANRVEYRRGQLTEWYANGPMGLEQGFTLTAPPAGTKKGPLSLELAISGNLQATLDKNILMLGARGQPALRYRGLAAVDATGRELPAALALSGATLKLTVDDSGARYPVVIDPVIEQAKLIASIGKAEDLFGYSVAISGDTVVIGAPYVDVDTQNNRGLAYVFVKPEGGWTTAKPF